MCGIAGLIGSHINQDSKIINKMINCIEHRGPDSINVKKLDHNFGYLAHSRLSIIDIKNGTQPMEFMSRYLISFNGEIYNYIELKEELKLKGYKFLTYSDTEVLLAAFHEWGSECLNKFLGMFAFVIWDNKKQKLFAARDRFGKKPFVYTIQNKIFYFSSEIKSLTKTPNFTRKINRDSLIQYFTFGYVPSPNTIWENIYKLDPGCYIEWDNEDLKIETYDDCNLKINTSIKHSDIESNFIERFDDAVKIRYRSDVPVGLFLSGGIDSTMVAISSYRQGLNPKAITLNFDVNDNNSKNDLFYAKIVAKKYNLDHEVVTINSNNFINEIDDYFYHYDEPFADSSSVACYQIAKATSGKLKVVLNGDGGDEAFAGYEYYQNAQSNYYKKKIAAFFGIRKIDFRNTFEILGSNKLVFAPERINKLFNNNSAFYNYANYINNNIKLNQINSKSHSVLKNYLFYDRYIHLPNDLMFKMDIALSAFGIEGRSPFLDHRVMELSSLMRDDQLSDRLNSKKLLKKIVCDQFGESFVNRKKKGFGSPIYSWVKGDLSALLEEKLKRGILVKIVDQENLKTLINDSLKVKNAFPAWAFLIFELWAEKWKAII